METHLTFASSIEARAVALAAILVWVWLLPVGAPLEAEASTAVKPNIVIIMTDDQRADTFTLEFMPFTYD